MGEEAKKSDAITSIYYYGEPVKIHELSTGTIAIFLGKHTIMIEDRTAVLELMWAIEDFMGKEDDQV